MNKVLIISSHPDDETLGCGGTILKHKAIKDRIFWLIMTNISVKESFSRAKVNKQQRYIDLVAREYGFKDVFKLDFPAAGLDMIPISRMLAAAGNVIKKISPEVIYLPNRSDIHSDHRITFDVVMSLTKSFRAPFIKKILMYEVISETEFSPALLNNAFLPNVFSDISKHMDKKKYIMKIYKDELGRHPFPRSIENIKSLATFRGATAGVKYAEAFMLLKDIW